MSELENITDGLESLTEEEKAELSDRLTKVMTETKSRFIEGKRRDALTERYNAELARVNLNGMSSGQRVRVLNELKAKYRSQGLEVW